MEFREVIARTGKIPKTQMGSLNNEFLKVWKTFLKLDLSKDVLLLYKLQRCYRFIFYFMRVVLILLILPFLLIIISKIKNTI
ncbi:MAG: hypothetical protein PQJ46_10410 [Spirochaetales bacterium]|nr:hypothetical protein [Spirochaetales bacterium]